MICHERKFIFIHIRRTGGTSVEAALGGADFDSDRPIAPGNEPVQFEQDGQEYKHRKLRDFDPDIVNRYFTFTVVRNPWDRVVSRYFWEKQLGRKCIRPFPDFESYVLAREDLSVDSWNVTGDFARKYTTQLSYIQLNGEIGVDEMVRFERREDLARVLKSLGVDSAKLPHLFSSDHNPYWQYYTDKTREIVQQAYSEDIEKLGYSFYPA